MRGQVRTSKGKGKQAELQAKIMAPDTTIDGPEDAQITLGDVRLIHRPNRKHDKFLLKKYANVIIQRFFTERFFKFPRAKSNKESVEICWRTPILKAMNLVVMVIVRHIRQSSWNKIFQRKILRTINDWLVWFSYFTSFFPKSSWNKISKMLCTYTAWDLYLCLLSYMQSIVVSSPTVSKNIYSCVLPYIEQQFVLVSRQFASFLWCMLVPVCVKLWLPSRQRKVKV